MILQKYNGSVTIVVIVLSLKMISCVTVEGLRC
jgi:hypothetical protein